MEQPQLQPSTNQTLSPQPNLKTRKKKGKEVPVVESLMDRFLAEYFKPELNFNATQAMMNVSGVRNRANAAAMAHNYLKKANLAGRIALEQKGYSYGKMLDVAIKRMNNAGEKSSDFVALWDRLMKIGGYEDFLTKQGVTKATVNVLQTQKEIIDEYVDGEYVEDGQ